MHEKKGSTLLLVFVFILSSITISACKPNVSKLSRKRDVEKLVEVLDHKNWEIRRDAAIALGELKDPKAIDPLINIFYTTDIQLEGEVDVWRATKESLINFGEPAVAPLLKIQDEKQFNSGAFYVLAEIGGEQSIDYFISTLAQEDQKLLIERAQEVLIEVGDPAIEPLVSALEDSVIAPNAIKVLDELNVQPEITLDYLMYFIRTDQFDKIFEIGDDANPQLILLLKNNSEDLKVRLKAAELLQSLGQSLNEIDDLQEEVVSHLVKIQNDEDQDWDVRINAAELLVILNDPGSLDTLINWLNEPYEYDHSTIDELHIFTVQQLGKIGDLRAVDPLLEVLKNEEAELKLIENVFLSLELISNPLIAELETALQSFGSICTDPEGWGGLDSINGEIPEQFYPVLILKNPRAEYDPLGENKNIDPAYIPFEWTGITLLSSSPKGNSSNLFIACVEQENRMVEECWYTGAKRYRKREEMEIILRDAYTGLEVASTIIKGEDPPICPSYLSKDASSSETYQTRINLNTVNKFFEEHIP